MRNSLPLLFPCLAAFSGCGSAAGPSYEPPYLTLGGTITSSSVSTPATVRVALVWRLGQSFREAQELDVRAEFPVKFRLDVRALPPKEVIASIDPSKTAPGRPTGYAFGTLVVYEDTNGNGKLDLVPVDATASTDRVLGAPEGLEVIYLEGGGIPKNPNAPPTDEDFVEHTAGFNLVVEPTRVDPEPGCTSCAPTFVSAWTRLPLDADLSVALTADPQLSRALCEQTGGEGATASSACQPCLGDACSRCSIATDARVTCNADKTAFVAFSCTANSVCADHVCKYISGRRIATDPVPAAWPCP